MSDNQDPDLRSELDEVADNPGARLAAMNANPALGNVEAANAVEGEGPNASGSVGASNAQEHVPSTSDPDATDIPSANAPEPEEANPETNPNAVGSKNRRS
ncbi:hypothetical protein [Pseudanabaena sp. FACHB-2040]|uniref:hypothetical protein n=1 Tax=Pseudanabaena sp. FACHB-2040 TaxID=2692859 RepID=UPI0016854BB5|nr:hypothetical protein [Pseudanabaena sp. FACHB-2040]MBD2256196.1 hypothetical protein [Pseudanabaena sp. FACHB-2040]